MPYKTLKAVTMLSPLAGYTDAAYRYICSAFGVGLTVTEMVSAKSLQMHNKNALDLLFSFQKQPKAVQLFGCETEAFRYAVQLKQVQEYDIIEINMGCPMPKITKNGDGAALMTDLDKASSLIKTVVSASQKPVSIKFRLGWDERSINCVDFAKMCEQSGASSITLHARTREQVYSGQARHSYTALVAEAVKIPVWANGDIDGKEKADEVMRLTGCFGVAIGRAAIGNPQIFCKINGQRKIALQEDVLFDDGQLNTKAVLFNQIALMSSYLPSKIVSNEIKKHIACYVKGMRGGKILLSEINRAKDTKKILDLLENFFG